MVSCCHQVAVVGEQQQTFAHVIEAADGKDALLDALEQIHHRGTALGIADGGHVSLGLVHRKIDVALGTAQQLAVDANLIQARIGLGAGLGDGMSVDGDQAGGDQLLGLAPRGQSCRGQNLL